MAGSTAVLFGGRDVTDPAFMARLGVGGATVVNLDEVDIAREGPQTRLTFDKVIEEMAHRLRGS